MAHANISLNLGNLYPYFAIKKTWKNPGFLRYVLVAKKQRIMILSERF